jgi:polyferredoxin/Flp pilus assembly protein TadD
VLTDPASRTKTRPRSRIAKWRAASLILVYLLITAHVLHWWITGHTVGRFVLSDSMQALEIGEITPGFLMFAAVLLLTAIMGRFMCGWFCHMGALQDLCAWILRKIGLRPHLFRSRFLGFVPLGLALYMFVWPTLKREAVAPALGRVWPEAGAWLGPVTEFSGFTFLMTTDRLWDGLPSVWVGIPFLIVCGFATVWFFGARGLCRYGCPYGGLILPVEQLAPARVVLDPNKCDQCGLCTGACTAGVRVHDQVREFGAIMDRNCVRSLDCVSVCPQGALSLGLGRPAALTRKAKTPLPASGYDVSWGEEFVLAGVFAGTFLILRGLYGLLPMLLSAAIAVLVSYILWKSISLVKRENVRLGGARLKLRSRLTPVGWGFAGVAAGLMLLLVHSGVIQLMIRAGGRADDRVGVSLDAVMQGQPVPESDRASAHAALDWYTRAQGFSRGGWGLTDTPQTCVRIAWLRLVVGDREGAVAELRWLARSGRGNDQSCVELARLLLASDRMPEAERELTDACRENPSWNESRDLLCAVWANTDRVALAEKEYRSVLARYAADATTRIGLARLFMAAHRESEAVAEAARAAHDAPQEPRVRADYAMILAALERTDDAVSELKSAAAARPAARRYLLTLGANLLRQAGRKPEAAALEATVRPPS